MIRLFFFIFLFPLAAFGEIKNDIDFVRASAHLDFNAPATCKINVSSGVQKRDSSFELLKRHCRLKEPRIDADLAKMAYIQICTMLVPALNTSGKDIIGDCKSKNSSGNNIVFEGCGPLHNVYVELNISKLSVTIRPTGKDSADQIITTYSLNKDHLYPRAIILKNAEGSSSISSISYSGNAPSSIKGDSNSKKIMISFSDCVGNPHGVGKLSK